MLYDGYGEGVCFIVNDLTNRELIRRNFKFEQYKILEGPNSQDHREDINSIEEDMIIEGSTVFSNTMMLDQLQQ
jgi:hypothetical protein